MRAGVEAGSKLQSTEYGQAKTCHSGHARALQRAKISLPAKKALEKGLRVPWLTGVRRKFHQPGV
ncbi:predicted protein [Coccidioides posadasii str. Silveira]|uniref:Predicted protein n=1 Tax=Coccidioides posadasii (strain RMSCC 757 / Silveira) TaxID=443226 RepID=E9DAN9_COCPS|nr:predicted protein [Coccidioides posadasii str. Silveira]